MLENEQRVQQNVQLLRVTVADRGLVRKANCASRLR